MAQLEYPQLLFEKHDQSKFYKYEEIQNHQGFRLPDDQKNTIYLLDQDGGWCDLNGCYYNSQGQPNGWILLSKDGQKYMKFDMNADLIIEQSNIYYSNNNYDAAPSKQYQQQYQNNNKQQLKENQQLKNYSNKQQNQTYKDHLKKQKDYKGKQKDIEGEKDKMGVISQKVQDSEQIKNQLQDSQNVEKNNNNQAKPFRNQRDRKQNDKWSKNNKSNKKDDSNQNNNETKKYYILNIQENTLSKEELIKYLVEQYKIRNESIIEINDNILKLAQEKDAIKLYRVNKKEQTDKVQKFIISI